MLGIDFSKYTVANYVSMAFGITYLVLTIIALVAVYSKVPKIDLARNVFTGLLTLSAFGFGFLLGEHKKVDGASIIKWNGASGVAALSSLVFIITAIIATGLVHAGKIQGTKNSLIAMLILSVPMVYGAAKL